MSATTMATLLGLGALMPLSLAAFFGGRRDDNTPPAWFWVLISVAVAGLVGWTVERIALGWSAQLADALWASVTACMVCFAIVCGVRPAAWRLTRLVMAYLLCLGLAATLTGVLTPAPSTPAPPTRVDVWIGLHIAVSVVTYALITLSAVAALAAILKERALKRKQPPGPFGLLPPVLECEWLEVRLLAAAEVVLATGVLSGFALLAARQGWAIALDHKSVLSISAFLLIGVLLFVRARTGARGRGLARWVLVAYLLLTLAYPGVKFVQEVVLGRMA